MHFLILGARSPVALEWCRLLKQLDYRITIADSVRFPITRFTKFYDHYLKLPSARFDTEEWSKVLVDYIRQESVSVMIPNAEEAFYLSHQAKFFKPYCEVWTSDFLLMDELHNKLSFTSIVKGLSIEAPLTWALDQIKDIDQLPLSLDQLVLKPIYSRFASSTLIQPTEREISKAFSDNQQWVAQQYIKGVEYCSYSILYEGEVLAHTVYQPTYRAGKGAGIYLQPVKTKEVENFVAEFGHKTGYTGQVGFDFIRNDDGRFLVLECNPRGTSGIHLFRSSQKLLAQAVLKHEGNPLKVYPSQASTFKFAMCFVSLIKNIRNYQQWWKDYHHSLDIIYYPQDIKPMLFQFLPTIEMLWIAKRQKISVWEATTYDIEWNGKHIL